jgi:hypothetical protein
MSLPDGTPEGRALRSRLWIPIVAPAEGGILPDFGIIPGRQSVDRSSVMPAKAGIQANAAEFGAARLDSRLRGSDESGQRTGSLV